MLGVNADFGSSPLLLASVYDGSGAADAGLQVGDIIHQIDGVKIRDFSELTICISAKKPGEQIEVVYERGGKRQTAAIKLTRRTIDD
jgi:putative serine protease PepD